MQSKVRAHAFAFAVVFSIFINSQSSGAGEILAREIGPRSEVPLSGFNINYFDFNKAPNARVNCGEIARSKTCPRDMTLVCSEHFRTAVCIDTNLVSDAANGRPRGNMNLAACQAACAAQGKRIPKNNEWLVACTGTRPEACLNYRGSWPPGRFAAIPGHTCQINGPTSGPCLTSPDLVAELPPVAQSCVSEAGVRGCVGTFHQWVSEHVIGAQHGYYRFNGGSYVVAASAVEYVTPAHSNDFYHYANGCRCARDL